MKTALDFHSLLAHGGEILAESGTFLPGKNGTATRRIGVIASELTFLAAFRGFLRGGKENLTMAQPLLNGGLQ